MLHAHILHICARGSKSADYKPHSHVRLLNERVAAIRNSGLCIGIIIPLVFDNIRCRMQHAM